MFPYRIDMATDEELEADPFGGDGVFLPGPGNGAEEMLIRLGVIFGRTLPAVASPGKGVWVDAGQAGISADELTARWRG